MPALQYLDVVDKGGMADRAGLKPGDFILQVSSGTVFGKKLLLSFFLLAQGCACHERDGQVVNPYHLSLSLNE